MAPPCGTPYGASLYGPVLVTVLLNSVTAPDLAIARPLTVAPVPREIDACARIVPLNTDAVLSVAELPTCQNTLHGFALLINVTLLPTAVVSVEAI